MSDRWLNVLKKDKAFLTAFALNLIISISNIFIGDMNFFIRTFGVFFVLMLVIMYRLIDTVDKYFEETYYLNNINTIFPTNFNKLIEESNEICLLGIHLNSFLSDYNDSINKALMNGARIRVLLISPQSEAVRMTASRYTQFNGNSKYEREVQKLNTTRDILKTLDSKYLNKISVKEVDYLFEHELIILKNLTIDSRYNFGTKSSSNKPKFFYKPGTEWYKFCQDEFENHWNSVNKEASLDTSYG